MTCRSYYFYTHVSTKINIELMFHVTSLKNKQMALTGNGT